MQKDASNYFDKDSITYKKSSSIIPENIIEIEELIVQLRNDTIFLNSIYYEEDGAYYEPLKEIIFEDIDNYKNKNDEKILLEKMTFLVFITLPITNPHRPIRIDR